MNETSFSGPVPRLALCGSAIVTFLVLCCIYYLSRPSNPSNGSVQRTGPDSVRGAPLSESPSQSASSPFAKGTNPAPAQKKKTPLSVAEKKAVEEGIKHIRVVGRQIMAENAKIISERNFDGGRQLVIAISAPTVSQIHTLGAAYTKELDPFENSASYSDIRRPLETAYNEFARFAKDYRALNVTVHDDTGLIEVIVSNVDDPVTAIPDKDGFVATDGRVWPFIGGDNGWKDMYGLVVPQYQQPAGTVSVPTH